MSNQEIAINTSTLNTDINALRAALDKARKQIDDMFNDIKELDTMWDGMANDAFNKQFASDYENAQSLCKTVESLIECMEFAKQQYNACENAVSGIVDTISI